MDIKAIVSLPFAIGTLLFTSMIFMFGYFRVSNTVYAISDPFISHYGGVGLMYMTMSFIFVVVVMIGVTVVYFIESYRRK